MDPYFEFKLEIEQNLTTIISLNSSYKRLLLSSNNQQQQQQQKNSSSSSDSELSYNLAELKSNLNIIELDLIELNEILLSIESNNNNGIGLNQIKERRSFLNRVNKEVKVSLVLSFHLPSPLSLFPPTSTSTSTIYTQQLSSSSLLRCCCCSCCFLSSACLFTFFFSYKSSFLPQTIRKSLASTSSSTVCISFQSSSTFY